MVQMSCIRDADELQLHKAVITIDCSLLAAKNEESVPVVSRVSLWNGRPWRRPDRARRNWARGRRCRLPRLLQRAKPYAYSRSLILGLPDLCELACKLFSLLLGLNKY